jgi:hypothetical protein
MYVYVYIHTYDIHTYRGIRGLFRSRVPASDADGARVRSVVPNVFIVREHILVSKRTHSS